VILSLVLLAAPHCQDFFERDTTIEMDGKNPPTFTLSGNGQIGWIQVMDLSVRDVSFYAPERVLWKITPSGENTPSRLPKITYGGREVRRSGRGQLERREELAVGVSWGATSGSFQEMLFEELPACVDESYRLIWIPSFHSPVSVWIWSSRGKRFIVTKQLDGKGGYGMGQLALEEMRSLSEDEWNGFMRLLSQARYWDMPSIDDSPPPNDGAAWVIDGIQNRKRHHVNRRSPGAEFRAACVYLVKLSRLKTEIERY
jgi:hypothetical protein